MDGRFPWLAPMVLWPSARPLIPEPTERPQGGGTQRTDDEATFAAVVYVLVSGSAWRTVPRVFGISWQTTHRRFTQWCRAGLWQQLCGAVLASGDADAACWADAVAVAAAERLRDTDRPDSGGRPGHKAQVVVGGGRRLRPRIERQYDGSFVERLFGGRKGPVPTSLADRTSPSRIT